MFPQREQFTTANHPGLDKKTMGQVCFERRAYTCPEPRLEYELASSSVLEHKDLQT